MKILIAHVRYRSRGGEDQVFEDEVAQLRAAGVDVATLEIPSTDLRQLSAAAITGVVLGGGDHPYGRSLIRKAIDESEPDVVHFHNIYPLLGVGAMREARASGCGVVRTYHNYRLSCLAGTHFRAHSICERCAPGDRSCGVSRGCYRGSIIQSAWMAAACESEWRSLVDDRLPDVAICQTAFAQKKLLGYGTPESSVVVKPNGVEAPENTAEQGRSGALFVGRLSPEKGVDRLVQAWGEELPLLTVIGDGPLLQRLRERRTPNILLAGRKSRAEARLLMSRARVLVVPSLAYEGDPLAIIEAFAAGTPVMCFDHGPLARIGEQLTADCVVPTGDFPALVRGAARIHRMAHADWVVLSDRTTGAYQREHTQERSVEALLGVYSRLAVQVLRAQRGAGL